MKNTKRALLLSALAIVMSIAMLIGSTFAWFTDSASTAVNTIQSGTLDVALEYSLDDGATWKNAEGQTLDFVKAAGAAANEAVLWEPGCTYELPLIRVRNNGNLALKYEISVIGATGDLKLFDVISFTAAIDGAAEVPLSTFTGHLDAKDASSKILIKGHMDEDAGNEYQGLEIKNIAINVLATQYTYEYDSNDNQYDKDAVFAAKDVTDLKKLLTKGGNIKLVKDITTTETLEVPADKTVALDLNGKTITSTMTSGRAIVTQGTLTLKNGTIVTNNGVNGVYATGSTAGLTLTDMVINVNGTGTNAEWNHAAIGAANGASVTVNNGTYSAEVGYGLCVMTSGAHIIINDGTFTTGGTTNSAAVRLDSGWASDKIYTAAVINGGTFNAPEGGWAFTASNAYGKDITINGGIFNGELDSSYQDNGVVINGGTFNKTIFQGGGHQDKYLIKGGTFAENVSAKVAAGYIAVDNGDGTYTVLPKVEGAELTYYADGLYSDANSSKNYYVASGAGMDTVAEKINDGTLAKNTNITLLTDIDLTDVDYAPISGNKGDSWYTGTFDGQNHTITGMTVNAYEGGLIGSSNGTVKNVIIDGATVTGSYHAAGIVGTGYGSIQNCTVKNSAIIGNYAGALRGYSASGTNTGNTVENCTINGKYAAGGLFGLVTADGKNTISDNTVKNCDIYCEVPSGNSYNGIGEVVGRSASDKVVIENNMTENVTLH